MKKVAQMLVFLLLMMIALNSACAQGAVCAGAMVDHDQLQRYPSYLIDNETGKWSIQAYQADALVDRFWSYGIKNNSKTCVFHLAAEGDARTGVWNPVLRFYYIDGETINARAVAVMVDGERYDLAASSAQIKQGRYAAECITVPLNNEAMEIVALLMQAETATVRLIGENTHTVEFSRAATTERRTLEATSLEMLPSGMELLSLLGLEQYGLWDLSAQQWKKEYGYQPAVTKGVVAETLCEEAVTDVMGMILPESRSEAAVAVQDVLIGHGFLSGTAYWMFDDNAVDATLRAQRYLGRVQTGCFDAGLQQALEEGVSAEAKEEAPVKQLGDTAEIGVDRFWFAKGVSASENAETLRSVANEDNVFLAADGVIRNLSQDELHLFMQVEASVVYQGQYAYEAELVCECSGGTVLDSLLLPMGQARLIAYAEVPAELAQDAQAEWSLVFTAGDESIEFDLQ